MQRSIHGVNLDAGNPIQATIIDCLQHAILVVVSHDSVQILPSERLKMDEPRVIDGLRRIWGCRGMSGGSKF